MNNLVAGVLACVAVARIAAAMVLPAESQSLESMPNVSTIAALSLVCVVLGGLGVSYDNTYRHPWLIRLFVIAWGLIVFAAGLSFLLPHSIHIWR